MGKLNRRFVCIVSVVTRELNLRMAFPRGLAAVGWASHQCGLRCGASAAHGQCMVCVVLQQCMHACCVLLCAALDDSYTA